MVADTVYVSFYSVKEIAELRCAYDHFVLKMNNLTTSPVAQ